MVSHELFCVISLFILTGKSHIFGKKDCFHFFSISTFTILLAYTVFRFIALFRVHTTFYLKGLGLVTQGRYIWRLCDHQVEQLWRVIWVLQFSHTWTCIGLNEIYDLNIIRIELTNAELGFKFWAIGNCNHWNVRVHVCTYEYMARTSTWFIDRT